MMKNRPTECCHEWREVTADIASMLGASAAVAGRYFLCTKCLIFGILIPTRKPTKH
jgi:hypothetical protein